MNNILLLPNGRITMQTYRNIMNPILYTKQLTDTSYAALDELGLIFDHILTSLKPLDQ